MERFKRTIKQIAAIAGGAVMVGATMAGALAALDSLPAPFVTAAGAFDSYIVVGTLGWNPNAAYNADAVTGLARDVATGIDISAAFAQKATSAAAGGSTTTTVSAGKLIDASGNPFNFDDAIFSVKESLKSGDLDILKDGTFKDTKGTNKANTDYTQKLDFNAATGNLTNEKNTKDDKKLTSDYLKFVDASNAWAYTYTLKFDSNIAIDSATTNDLNQNKLSILGKSYTISDADINASGFLDKMSLLAGSVLATQSEYTTQSYTVNGKTYDVEVVAVAEGTGSVLQAKLRINGEPTDALAVSDTFTLADGTVIGIQELLSNEGSEAAGADQVTFYIGADKLVLDPSASYIKMNDDDVKDSKVQFNAGTTPVADLSNITVTWKPTDTTYLEAGESLADPVFGAFKFVFAGLTAPATETISISPNGDDKISLAAYNKDGKLLDFDIFGNYSGTINFGEESDNKLYIGNMNATAATSDMNTLEGSRFLYDFNSIAHIVEVTNIDTTTSKVKFSVDGNEESGDGTAFVDGAVTSFTPSGVDKAFKLQINNTAAFKNITFVEINDNGAVQLSEINTKYNGRIYFTPAAGTVYFDEVDSGNNTVLAKATATTVSYDVANQRLNIAKPVGTGVSFNEKSTDDKDNSIARTKHGTLWEAYTKDAGDVKVTFPDGEVTGKIYVAPTSATTATASTSGSVNINYVNAATGIARTDVDFATAVPTKNVILIGGPTVNELVSDLAAAGKTWTSAAWASKVDTAVIDLVEGAYGSYNALVIAGYESKDTVLAGKVVASRVLQNQFASDLTGTHVELSTAGASTVNEVKFS